jgi:AcrR family transcriptional regulator
MAKRSEHSLEELKALVLKAAETIVIGEGFSALKMRRIAMDIGYTVGSIYMVFNNMADLIMHINAKTLDAIAAELKQVQDCNIEPSIETLAIAYLGYANQNFNRWRNVFENPFPTETKTPDWYQDKFDNVFALIDERFAKFKPELAEGHRKRAARALWCGIHGICVLSLKGELDKTDINDIEESIVLLARSFMQGWIEHANE